VCGHAGQVSIASRFCTIGPPVTFKLGDAQMNNTLIVHIPFILGSSVSALVAFAPSSAWAQDCAFGPNQQVCGTGQVCMTDCDNRGGHHCQPIGAKCCLNAGSYACLPPKICLMTAKGESCVAQGSTWCGGDNICTPDQNCVYPRCVPKPK
jgi:hypothetical protein